MEMHKKIKIGNIKHKKVYDLRHCNEHYAWCKTLNQCKKAIKTYLELNADRISNIREIDDWEAIETVAFDMKLPKFKFVPED